MAEYTRIIENLVLTDTLTLSGSQWDNTLVRNVTIQNVKGNGIMLRDVSNVRIENVTIDNVTGDGIKLSTLGSTSGVTIVNCKISNIGDDGINAGQRIEDGVDHPGLKIIGNTIDNTGLNSGTSGLLHGIYVQTSDFLIEGNVVTNSVDGNAISVRSSGVVRGNYTSDSRESGIAYYADHAAGPSDTLIIEDNVIIGSGNGTSRSDIDLLRIPDGQASQTVSTFIIRNNILTDDDGTPVRVEGSYKSIGAGVTISDNTVVGTGAAEKAWADRIALPEPEPEPEPQPEPEPEPQPEPEPEPDNTIWD